MKSHLKKVISVILAVMMLMSTLTVLGFAADTDAQTWTKVALSEITSDDKIAITMTYGDTTWVLPAATTSSAPAAVVASVDGDTLTTNAADYSWTIDETDGGYHITNAEDIAKLEDVLEGKHVGTIFKAHKNSDFHLIDYISQK